MTFHGLGMSTWHFMARVCQHDISWLEFCHVYVKNMSNMDCHG